MTIIRISVFITTLIMLSAYGNLSNAQEIVLCINPVDKYIVAVEKDGDCLEEETRVKMKGAATADLKGLTPVAVFEDNELCDTEGSKIKFGFDKNGNNELDEDELESTSRTCAVVEDQSSDE